MSKDSLQEWRDAVDAHVRKVVKENVRKSEHKLLPDYATYPMIALTKELETLAIEKASSDASVSFSPPPSNVPAAADCDLACNVAGYAKTTGTPIQDVAKHIVQRLEKHPMIERVSVAGPFVNLRLRKTELAARVLTSVEELGARYGHFNRGNGGVAFVDFCALNIAKNMTVGHLRSTLIGHVVCNIHAAAGFAPVRDNYLGDWGTQFGKLIYEYRKERARDASTLDRRLESDPITTLMELYRAFVAREEEDEAALEEARANFLKLEQGDPEITALWEKFREASLEEFEKIFKRLAIDFDTYQGESAFAKLALDAVREGLAKGVLRKDSEDAVVFPQQMITLPSGKDVEMKKDEIILKPSGGTVYLARDLAAIRYRAQDLGSAKIIYVVGKEQEMHLAMLFRMAEKLGYIRPGQALHVPFGLLTVEGKKMGSRKGQVMLMADILDDAIENAAAMLKEHNADRGPSPDDGEIARKVAVGSLFYNDLKQSRERNIAFDPAKAVAIEAGQGPYIQYSYARIGSILRGLDLGNTSTPLPETLSPEESSLILHLSQFPESIGEALNVNAPHKIATYLDQLCKLINTFYQNHHVQKSEGKERAFRIRLMLACKRTMENAAAIIHLPLPERM